MYMYKILVEYNQLEECFFGEYNEFKYVFCVMFFRIIEYLNNGQFVMKFYDFFGGLEERIKIIQQFEILWFCGFDYLVSFFE